MIAVHAPYHARPQNAAPERPRTRKGLQRPDRSHRDAMPARFSTRKASARQDRGSSTRATLTDLRGAFRAAITRAAQHATFPASVRRQWHRAARPVLSTRHAPADGKTAAACLSVPTDRPRSGDGRPCGSNRRAAGPPGSKETASSSGPVLRTTANLTAGHSKPHFTRCSTPQPTHRLPQAGSPSFAVEARRNVPPPRAR